MKNTAWNRTHHCHSKKISSMLSGHQMFPMSILHTLAFTTKASFWRCPSATSKSTYCTSLAGPSVLAQQRGTSTELSTCTLSKPSARKAMERLESWLRGQVNWQMIKEVWFGAFRIHSVLQWGEISTTKLSSKWKRLMCSYCLSSLWTTNYPFRTMFSSFSSRVFLF